MVKQKTKQKTKQKKNKQIKYKQKHKLKKQVRSKKTKLNIIDVPLSTRISLGTLASDGYIGYHYQAYDNIYDFFTKILKQDNNLNDLLCFPDKKDEWMNSFIKINLDPQDLKSSELVIQNMNLRNPNENLKIILDVVKTCENKGKRFFILTIMLIVPGKSGSHANIVVIDLHEKTIELFEPHGKRTELSTLDSLEGAYHMTDRLLKKMFSKILPGYGYISPQNYLPTYGLQARIDAYTGLCVTWSIMYVHYRILNPKINRKILVRYMSTLKKQFLLKYAKYIEETIKNNNI